MSKNNRKFVDYEDDEFYPDDYNRNRKKDKRQLRKNAREQKDFINQTCVIPDDEETEKEN